ncbi:hypothetical protein [Nitrosococcus wardiae]|uniref:DNA-binding protein n=1 Tax=Nitrosococcus wardiae TaxID=1814290 RepID=A0A4P7BXH4_9GAMM|nr:hypothetical protein [Nitrosococcus wardiae]QBQ53844.1 hypothetical protein E3U44_04435 [Nitrosococcus wardiae]
MTPNQRLIEMMEERGLDTRPDSRLNHDVDHIAEILGVSRRTVLNWISPPHWKTYRGMRWIYLDKLESLP